MTEAVLIDGGRTLRAAPAAPVAKVAAQLGVARARRRSSRSWRCSSSFRRSRCSRRHSSTNEGNFGLEAFKDAFTGQNLDAFKFSVKFSALAAAVGVVVGALPRLRGSRRSADRNGCARSSPRSAGWRPTSAAPAGVRVHRPARPPGTGDQDPRRAGLRPVRPRVPARHHVRVRVGVLVLQHPADGAHHAAGDRRPEGRRGARRAPTSAARRSRTGGGSGCRCSRRRCSAGSCCCSPTRSAPTRRRAAMTDTIADRPAADPVLPERRLRRSGPTGLLAGGLDDHHHGGLDGPVLDAAQAGRAMAVVDPTGLSAVVTGGPTAEPPARLLSAACARPAGSGVWCRSRSSIVVRTVLHPPAAGDGAVRAAEHADGPPRLVDAVRQVVVQWHHQGVRRSRVPHVAVPQPQARHRHRRPDAGPVAAHHAVGAPPPAEGPRVRRVPDRAAVRDPTDRTGRRHPADQAARAVVPQLRLLADPLLHRAGAAVHVPGDRRRRPGARRADARRCVAQPRGRLGHHAATGA